MARKALNTSYAFTFTGEGTGLSGAPVETNAAKCEANFTELYAAKDLVKRQCITLCFAVDLALDVQRVFGRMPVAGTVVSIDWIVSEAASSAGAVSGMVKGAANDLQAAVKDLKTITPKAVSNAPLTGTTANLSLAAGDLIEGYIDNSAAATTDLLGVSAIVTYDVVA